MVQDAACLTHSAGGDHDAGLAATRHRLGFLPGLYELNLRSVKDAAVIVQQLFRFPVVAIRVQTEYVRGVDGQGTVNVYGNAAQFPLRNNLRRS